MNIALVVHDFDPSIGHGRYCYELARRLAPRHTITVYANRFATEPSQGTWQQIKVKAWRATALTSVFSFLASSERLVMAGNHDLIHAQGLTCWSADVITAHVCNVARHAVTPPRNLRSLFFPALVNRVEERFYRQRRARHLIAISGKVASEIQQHYGWKRPCSVVHHGVDSVVFRPPVDSTERRSVRDFFALPNADWVWLFVGEAVKGLHAVISQLPHFPGARLLVISRSDTRQCEAYSIKLGVRNRVNFHGPVRETWMAYRAADVFVYPSNYDTFGMVVTEAMASGLPVIAGKTIGAAEIISDGENGLLVDPASSTDLQNLLATLNSSRELGAKLGRNARSRAADLTWDACALQTEGVYTGMQRTG